MRIKMLVSTAVQAPVAGPDGKVPQREVEFRDAKYRVASTVNKYLFAGQVYDLPEDQAKAQIALGHAVATEETVTPPDEATQHLTPPSATQPGSPVTVQPAPAPAAAAPAPAAAPAASTPPPAPAPAPAPKAAS